MIYLKEFYLPSEQTEYRMICTKRNIHNSYYPLRIFPEKELHSLQFAPITILYGGNGSGKSTLLHAISKKINAQQKNPNHLGDLFDAYVKNCDFTLQDGTYSEAKLILSDDVFDYLLDLRAINTNVNRRKDKLSDEYHYYKKKKAIEFSSMAQYEDLKNKVDANRLTESKYIRSRLQNNNLIQESNGQTALSFWQNEIKENAIYLIDEPENSLSVKNQLLLKQFLEESARFFNCQLIIATHSPFLLSLKEAKIYDLDANPVSVKKWTELESIKTYYHFFKENEDLF